jgi:4'-phosphopantetheinyl transferase EntD
VALGRLGRPPQPTPVGPDREPLWPAGIVGSITHCADFCAAAVAESTDIAGLGIDAERTLPVAAGFARRVAGEAELAAAAAELAVAGTALDPAILLFSAKESAYKAWFPMTGERLGFRDCTVTLDRSSPTFTVSVHPPGRRGSPPVLQGRWAATGSHVFTVAHTRSGAGIRSSGSRGRQGAPG